MKRTFRRFLFWTLFILFIAIAPVIIYYSQGYRFDKYHGIFVHSGSITVKSVPASVRIFLNGDLQPTKSLDIINNSITLNGIRPGTYSLRVSADGYQNWEKKVEVHSGISTEFWNVALLPNEPKIQQLDAQNPERIFPSPFGKRIAYIESGDNQLKIWSLDIKNNTPQIVYSGNNMNFPESKIENLEWNYKESYILSPVNRQDRKDYLVASADLDIDPFFLSEISGMENLQKARWSPKEKESLYFLANTKNDPTPGLFRTDIGLKNTTPVIGNVRAFDFSSNYIYFIQSNNILYRSDLSGENIEQMTSQPFSDAEIGGQSRLIVYDENRQALITESGELYVHNKATDDTIKKFGDNIFGIQFSDDGKKMLFWNNNEISVLFLRKWEVQPARGENETQQIIRYSSSIENVFWYRDYEHAFFSNQGKTKMIELDPRDHRILMDIFSDGLDNFPAAYDSGNGRYFFVNEADGKRILNYIDIPEKTGFFQ